MSERAWTPGPWTAEWWQDEKRPWKKPQVRIDAADTVLIEDAYYCEDDVFGLTAADASLIALAPEMAEAILKCIDNTGCECSTYCGETCPMCDGTYEHEAVSAVAAKLKAIT